MKIKALAALCSKVKSIVLYDDGDRQWAGDGMPYITAKDGMFLTAIISPVKTGDPLHQWLCSLYNGIIRAHVYEDSGEE